MYTPNKTVVLRAASAVTVPTTEYGVYDTAKVSSAATSTTANKLVDTAGAFVVNGIAVGDIIKNTTTGKFALVTAIDSATQLSVGADIFSSTNTYVIYPGLGYAITGGQYTKMMLELAVTAAATDVGDTLDVYVDTSLDNGVTWFNLGHFTQVLGNGGAKKYIMVIGEDNAGATAVYETSADAAAGATRQIGFGNRLRFRAVSVDTGTLNCSFNYSLIALLKA